LNSNVESRSLDLPLSKVATLKVYSFKQWAPEVGIKLIRTKFCAPGLSPGCFVELLIGLGSSFLKMRRNYSERKNIKTLTTSIATVNSGPSVVLICISYPLHMVPGPEMYAITRNPNIMTGRYSSSSMIPMDLESCFQINCSPMTA
jgi:hypothetical protein